jgi:hypothetical protein
MQSQAKPAENPFTNLLVNILLPVVVLNKGGAYMSPQLTLIVALALPLGYGIHDYIRRGHKNYVSLLGVINILLTGGLALLAVSGIWFAFKEASLPLLLGILVLGSAWTRNPAARMMFCNPQVMNMEAIDGKLKEQGHEGLFADLLKRATILFSISFFVSAALNFVLAFSIFQDIDPNLAPTAREQILNEQIARMTWMGYAVIAVPLMIFSGALIYWFMKRVSAITGLPIASLMKSG